jgi:hypothetical protein
MWLDLYVVTLLVTAFSAEQNYLGDPHTLRLSIHICVCVCACVCVRGCECLSAHALRTGEMQVECRPGNCNGRTYITRIFNRVTNTEFITSDRRLLVKYAQPNNEVC